MHQIGNMPAPKDPVNQLTRTGKRSYPFGSFNEPLKKQSKVSYEQTIEDCKSKQMIPLISN